MKYSSLVFVCVSALLGSAEVGSQQLGPEVFRTLAVETVLPFKVRQYEPVFPLPAVPSQTASNFLTPEMALATFFESLRSANYAWNETCWTRASIEFNKRKNAEIGLTAGEAERRWKSQFGDKKFELLNRIEYEKYMIVEYRALLASNGQITETDTLILEKEDDKWLLTQALMNNPITFAWKSPERRIQVGPNTVGRLSKGIK